MMSQVYLDSEIEMGYVRDISQRAAVQQPEELHSGKIDADIVRSGNETVLPGNSTSALALFDLLVSLSSDFMAQGRNDDLVGGLQVENWSV